MGVLGALGRHGWLGGDPKKGSKHPQPNPSTGGRPQVTLGLISLGGHWGGCSLTHGGFGCPWSAWLAWGRPQEGVQAPPPRSIHRGAPQVTLSLISLWVHWGGCSLTHGGFGCPWSAWLAWRRPQEGVQAPPPGSIHRGAPHVTLGLISLWVHRGGCSLTHGGFGCPWPAWMAWGGPQEGVQDPTAGSIHRGAPQVTLGRISLWGPRGGCSLTHGGFGCPWSAWLAWGRPQEGVQAPTAESIHRGAPQVTLGLISLGDTGEAVHSHMGVLGALGRHGWLGGDPKKGSKHPHQDPSTGGRHRSL